MMNGIPGVSNLNVQMMNDMREQTFARLDPDGDGQIDLSELETKAQETGRSEGRFAQLLEDLAAADTDGDGLVSESEFDQMLQSGPPSGPPPGPPPSADMSQSLIDLLDTDGDGKIDLEELQAQTGNADGIESLFAQLLESQAAAGSDDEASVTPDESKPPGLYGSDSGMTGAANKVGMLLDQLG